VPTLLAPPLSLYVHFPWCVRKCPYCDFNSYTLQGDLAAAPYVARLVRDIEALSGEVAGREIVSIFFGGGTPSLFSPDSIAQVLAAARRYLMPGALAEVTLEANPGAIERGAFGEYRAAGVTRVSLGAQSFSPEALAALGRIHSPGETRRAAEELHAAGLDNFNLDLMYALPGQSRASATQDIAEALALSPAHLSHYQLTLEPGTIFAARPPPLPDEDEAAAMLEDCSARLAGGGFARYEVSAYAKPGRQCRHNLNYWRFGDYLGVGAGAHGKLTFPERAAIVRTVQPREPRRYLAATAGELTRRPVEPQELPFEFMLNALRLTGGFSIRDFTERTGLEPEAIARPLARLSTRNLIENTPEGSRATDLGMRFLNDLLSEFMPERAEMPGAFALSIGPNGPQRQSPGSLFTGASGSNGE